jgi:hypothetical protein
MARFHQPRDGGLIYAHLPCLSCSGSVALTASLLQ